MKDFFEFDHVFVGMTAKALEVGLHEVLYCTRKVIRRLLDKGHHLITRMKSNAVVYRPAEAAVPEPASLLLAVVLGGILPFLFRIRSAG